MMEKSQRMRETPTGLIQIFNFIKEADRLKTVLRNNYTTQTRRESVADHTWRLCLMVALMHDRYFAHLDFPKLLKMALIHDLGEAIRGDIPAPMQTDSMNKAYLERKDLKKLLEHLPSDMQADYLTLYDEYEAVSSTEARLLKALDKMETIIQHNQGETPPDFDFSYNLTYGKSYSGFDPIIRALRELVDEETLRSVKHSLPKHDDEEGLPKAI